MINLLIVDEHKIVRESLKLILADFDTLDVVAEAADVIKALDTFVWSGTNRYCAN